MATQLYTGELQDHEGNTLYPHTEASVVFLSSGATVQEKITELEGATGNAGSANSELTSKVSTLESEVNTLKNTTTPITKGGTGATTAKGAEYNILKGMSESTEAITDDTAVVFKQTSPSATNGVTIWKKASLLWNYIKAKADALYAKESHAHDAATTSADGFMSSSDKSKLDGIADGANKYTLPTATSSKLGGVKIGYEQNGKNYPVQLSDGKMYVNVPWADNNTTYQEASQSTAGLMSASDKKKVDSIDTTLLLKFVKDK